MATLTDISIFACLFKLEFESKCVNYIEKFFKSQTLASSTIDLQRLELRYLGMRLNR